MELSDLEYQKLADSLAPKSKTGKNCLKAFCIGGAICLLGQLLHDAWQMLGATQDSAALLTSVSLIFLSALFTGLSWYDDLAKHAGAGTLVPITGFANSITAPAVEFKTEGFVTGLAVKMFSIAGPVLVYGLSASVLYGLIYWFVTQVLG